MIKAKPDVVLDLPVDAQQTVVNAMVLPLLRRAGIGVTVTPTSSGMVLTLAFREPAAATDNTADKTKTFGTDSAEQAAALWDLKSRIEAARAQ